MNNLTLRAAPRAPPALRSSQRRFGSAAARLPGWANDAGANGCLGPAKKAGENQGKMVVSPSKMMVSPGKHGGLTWFNMV